METAALKAPMRPKQADPFKESGNLFLTAHLVSPS
jgi:hypothetical protein